MDIFMPISDYLSEHGDPRTNGLGHKMGKDEKGLIFFQCDAFPFVMLVR